MRRVSQRLSTTVVRVALMLLTVAAPLACGPQDDTACPDWTGRYCDKHDPWYRCDECGQVWYCRGSLQGDPYKGSLEKFPGDCACITEEGDWDRENEWCYRS